MHLQQRSPAAPAAAADKRSSRKKRQLKTEKLMIMNDQQSAPQGSSLADYLAASAAATDMAREASSIGSACAAELRPLQASMESFENLPEQGELALALVDSDPINGPDVEQIVLEEDGRLRLIEGPVSSKGTDAKKIEDGRLRLIESDADKIVLQKDGRLRLMDRPRPSSIRPEKSLSDNYYPSDNPSLNNNNHNYYPSDNNHNVNYDTPSLNDLNYDNNNHNLNNVNDNHSNLNEGNINGTLSVDNNYPNSNLSHNLDHDDDTFTNNKSSSLKRTISRPIRVKKSDSLDATWKAINHNKGSAINGNNKHLIRQSSRKDFKPSRGGRGVIVRDTNNYNKVKREPSISQDELNAKVESFIAKFNEQIRIERQQSILSYMQMVDRGS